MGGDGATIMQHDRRQDDRRLEAIEKAIERLEQRFEELWENGLNALGQRVAGLEGRCAAFHPAGGKITVTPAPAATGGEADAKHRELPRWAYLLIGGVLMAGGEGVKMLVAALAKALGQ